MADRTADTATLRTDPLGHLLGAPDGVGSPSTVALRPLPFLTHLELWVDPAGPAAARVASVLGRALPGAGEAAPGGTAGADADRVGPACVLWLGPGWYLLVDAPDTAGAWEAALADALGDSGCAVDVSAGRTALELTGPHALDVLAHGCSLDLHPRVFGPGRCARTRLAQARVVLHRLVPPGALRSAPQPGEHVPEQRLPGPRENGQGETWQRQDTTGDVPRFHVHVDTSYAEHLVRWLQDAMTEYVPSTPYVTPSDTAFVAPAGQVTP
jgi:sarcosine oxidase, subunit gamma